MSHNLTQHLLRAFWLAPTFMFPLLVVMPSHYALAKSGGCSRFGIDGLTCITVEGSELRVTSVKGSFTKLTGLCNWRYDIVYTDTNGNDYRTVRGSTNSGCKAEDSFSITYTPYQIFREGRVCARLYESGSYVDAACVSLFTSSNNPVSPL